MCDDTCSIMWQPCNTCHGRLDVAFETCKRMQGHLLCDRHITLDEILLKHKETHFLSLEENKWEEKTCRNRYITIIYHA